MFAASGCLDLVNASILLQYMDLRLLRPLMAGGSSPPALTTPPRAEAGQNRCSVHISQRNTPDPLDGEQPSTIRTVLDRPLLPCPILIRPTFWLSCVPPPSLEDRHLRTAGIILTCLASGI